MHGHSIPPHFRQFVSGGSKHSLHDGRKRDAGGDGSGGFGDIGDVLGDLDWVQLSSGSLFGLSSQLPVGFDSS